MIRDAANRCGSDALAFVGDALAELPRPTATDRASVRRRHRDKAVLRRWQERVLEVQSYRLAWWRSASRDLGYRRFFDID